MFTRVLSATVLCALLLCTSITWAQAPAAPPDVDQALRARVDQFFKYHVEGGAALRRAMEMVAEDSQDFYFTAEKMKVLKYDLAGIEYSDNFTRATATVNASHNKILPAGSIEMVESMPTTWKLENGKWTWYVDPSLMTAIPKLDPNAPKPVVPPGIDKPEVVMALGNDILRPSETNKQDVIFRWGRAGEDQIVFLNGYPGVELEVGWLQQDILPGLSVALEKVALKRGENGTVKFRYAPEAGIDANAPPRILPGPFKLVLLVEPFGQSIPLRVTFTP